LEQRSPGPDGKRTEQRSLGLAAEAHVVEVGVEVFLQDMVHRHDVFLAALLVQAEPPSLTFGIIVVNHHCARSADAGERIDHGADERAVSETGDGVRSDRVEELAGFIRGKHGRLAALALYSSRHD
jgi:hypothetical protein